MINTVEDILAIERIKKLRIKYAHYLDSGNIEGLLSLFSADAICQTDREPWRGREEIRTGLEKAFADYDSQKHGSYPFLHAITNQWVELTGNGTAQGRCYLIDLVTQRDKGESPLLLLGIYSDEYRLIEDSWQITRSRLDLAWPQRDILGGEPGIDLQLPQ
ncbi:MULTISPECIES: nuclear transport factor 2 family protein [Chryseobacterium]|uniref:nuclear transport factor 2 family protein n=1 Tax=Chryseobacterium TaxID=59732 RepID=UPI00162A669F|nr:MULTISPECIES: nuclear transport factor 2 family protein [Chryseobacterium]MBF6643877.1 nuclear transport factor 2 family protein [Chryseobacterium indologenes]MBU3047164.1 nuclear transport factor 2 family protein [Chryseobacterium indologenes]QQQ72396.1 nuclear transport factor 2 family protein [Chryseobacterium indologenes]WET50790.1 nuclear transport factor 2 family protein [Chryseobacterium indologenes]